MILISEEEDLPQSIWLLATGYLLLVRVPNQPPDPSPADQGPAINIKWPAGFRPN